VQVPNQIKISILTHFLLSKIQKNKQQDQFKAINHKKHLLSAFVDCGGFWGLLRP